MRFSGTLPRALRNTATLGLFTTLVKLAGAAKVIATARYFGAGDTIDAFLTAFLLPSFVADVFAGALTPSVIPALIRSSTNLNESATRLAQAALALGLGLMTTLAILMAISGPWLLPALGSSFSAQKLRLTLALFMALVFWLPMSGCIAVFRAVLNAHDRFALAAAAPIATPLVTILALAIAAPRWGVYSLCFGTLTGIAIEMLVLAFAVSRCGYAIRPVWFGWTPELRGITEQYAPLALGAILSSGSVIVDQAFAGMLGSGAVAVLAYGNKFAAVLLAIGASALSTAALPAFSRLAAQNAWGQLRRTASTYAYLGLGLSVPVTIILIFWSEPIVHLFLQHGSFSAAATPAVSATQKCALLQVPFALLLTLAVRLASAMSANALLLRIAIVAFTVNLIADFFFARLFGVAGIALSTALVQMVSVVVLIFLLVRKQPALARFRRSSILNSMRFCLVTVLSLFSVFSAIGQTVPLRAGVAKVDITPRTPEVMWGFEDRLAPATSTLDPLYARVLVLEAGQTRLALITLDLGRSFGPASLDQLKQSASRTSGITAVLAAASHTHSAPVLRDEYQSGPPAWEREALEKIEHAIEQATSQLAEARIGTGMGAAYIGHNRLKLNADGSVAWFERNPTRQKTAPVDPTVTVIRIDSKAGDADGGSGGLRVSSRDSRVGQ